MKEKEQVGCLHDSHQFIIILVDFKLNSFHLVGARSETEARTLTKAIQLANRFQEMTLMAVDLATDLNRSYLNWMVQSCNSGVKFFEVKSDMISSEENFKILKHFLVKSELIEHLCFKKYDMSKHQINSITSLIVTLPQTQIKAFKFIKCNFTDDDLPDIGRAIKHNGYLEYLYFEGCDITDKSLRFFSGLWQYVPFLEYFGLTYSPKVKGEIYFSSFLEKMVSELKLKTLDLSHNSLTEKISTILAEEVFNVKNVSLERLDLSHNQFTPKENWMIYQKFQDSMIKEKCQLIMEGYPIDGHYFFLIDDKQKSLTVELERIGIHRNQTKRLLLTRREKTKAKEIREEINMSILNQKTIEKIFKLCKVIDKQPFEFPPQYVEEAVRFIRETMMNADELGDYYGFHYSLECSKILGMNQKGIRLKANAFQNRTDSFTQELTRLLNFQIPETQANIILDELVEKAIKRDYRGDAIDLLFYLKNIRDSQANILLLKKTDAAAIEMNLMQKDPFFILNYDKEFANICRDYAKHSDKASDHLGYHYQWINYSLITRLTKQQIKSIINMEQEKSDKNKSKLNTFRSERALFLLSDIGSDEFEAGQEDKLLLITRALCRYRYYSKPYKSSRSSIEDRVDSIYRQRDDDDISNIDSKVLDSDKHSIIDRFGNKSPITGAGSEVVSAKAKSDIGEGTDEVKKAKSSNASVIGGRKENIDDALVLRDVSIGESGSLVEDEKLPFSINRTEYKIGLKVNTLVIKICRLDFNRQQTSIVGLVRQLLGILRYGKKQDFNNLVNDEEYIHGEIFLSLIRFIHNYKDSISKNLLINAVNLIAFISYFLKLEKKLSDYILKKFYHLNFKYIKNLQLGENKIKVIRQAHSFMSNILDKLDSNKFSTREGFEMPEDHKIVKLFEGYSLYLEFDILIIAKTLRTDKIRCKETQLVYQFIKEIQETDYLFEGVDLTPQGYWLFIECNEALVQDIPLNFDWTMKRVKHLLIWMKSYGKSQKYKLVFKKRIWSIRYRISLERFSSAKIDGIFYEVKRMYLVKNAFKDFCKLDKLVKLAGILSLIEDISNNNKRRFIKSGKMLVQKTVPEASYSILGETEWIRRIKKYIEKNSFLKNHSLISLKKEFLSYFLESPNYCSSFYMYGIVETNMKIRRIGHMSINLYGVNFFENSSFDYPKYHFALEHIDTILMLEDSLLLKFNDIKEEKILKIKIKSIVKEDIAHDMVSYMLLSLREPKKLFYAYNFISKYLTYGKKKNKFLKDSALKPMINRCLEEIARLRNVDVDLKSLPYSRKYQMGIKAQNNKGAFSIYKEKRKVDLTLQLSKNNSKTFVENRRTSRSSRNSRVEIAGFVRMSSKKKIEEARTAKQGQSGAETGRNQHVMSPRKGMFKQLRVQSEQKKRNVMDSDSEAESSGISGVEEKKVDDVRTRPQGVPRLNIMNGLTKSLMNLGVMESIGEGVAEEEDESDY